MSTLTDRMGDIAENAGGTWWKMLLEATGSLQNAAIVDLAIDGDYAHLDLRRAPFAADEELKQLAQASRDAAASALVAIGRADADVLASCALPGVYVPITDGSTR